MHKGVILLVKASSRDDANAKAEKFLNRHGDGKVWDWYQIGGRWTGTLTGYDPENDPRNMEQCSNCRGSGKTGQVKCFQCDGKGKRAKWPTDWVGVPDNICHLSDKKVLKVVRGWAKDWKKSRLADLARGMKRFKGDEHMLCYFLERKSAVKLDKFTFDSNVYDVEEKTNNLPKNCDGYWAVMVDMHH